MAISLRLLSSHHSIVAVALTILWQTLRTDKYTIKLGKNIVVCLDGIWNQPSTKDFGHLAETSDLKLFTMPQKTKSTPTARYNANQCMEYQDAEEYIRQIGFYYHGVGNKVEKSELGQL